MATKEEQLHTAAVLGDLAATKRILAAGGVDVNFRDSSGRSALLCAAIYGYKEIAIELLDAGADRTQKDKYGDTPEKYARDRGHTEIAYVLANYVRVPKTPEQVVINRVVGSRMFEEVYDFAALERVTLVHNGYYGPVEGVLREGFSAIEDKSETSFLRKAFNEHVKRGGKVDESLVFPVVRLAKNKLKPE